MICPLCESPDVAKVIYVGFPMRLCENAECGCLHGPWSFIAQWLPIVSEDEDGEPAWAFFVYEGWYPRALLAWLLW
jgi:hypothetical protein